jgi:hypothetical protein
MFESWSPPCHEKGEQQMGSASTGRQGRIDWRLGARAPVRLDQTARYSWKVRLIASTALFAALVVWFAGRKRWLQQQV